MEVCFATFQHCYDRDTELGKYWEETKADIADLVVAITKKMRRNKSIEGNLFTQFKETNIIEQVLDNYFYSDDIVLYLYAIEIISQALAQEPSGVTNIILLIQESQMSQTGETMRQPILEFIYCVLKQ